LSTTTMMMTMAVDDCFKCSSEGYHNFVIKLTRQGEPSLSTTIFCHYKHFYYTIERQQLLAVEQAMR